MLEETVEAPVKRGDVLGYLVYKLDGEELGRVTIIAAEDMEAAAFLDYMRKVWEAALF